MSNTKYARPLIVLILIVTSFFGTVHAQTAPPPSRPVKLAEVADAYEIEIITTEPGFPVETAHGEINGVAAERRHLDRYAGLFVAEFSLYPASFVERSRLKRVVFCEELSFAGQRRNAVPDFEHDTLYLDVSRGGKNRTYLRKVIHHEFFHLVDYRDDEQVYTDADWASLNPAEFRYGDGGIAAQGMPETSVLKNTIPGFLNHYSTTGVEEDKAEVFANLVVEFHHVERRAKMDAVLDAKVRRMKQLLEEFCPEMNEEFWNQVRQAKRADNQVKKP